MIRKAILSLGMLAVASAGYAQSKLPCGTDEFYKQQKARYPGIAAQEAKLKADIDRQLAARAFNPLAKTTANDSFTNWVEDTVTMHIPVVVHIVTDYAPGTPVITDNDIYGMIDRLNTYYSAKNAGIPGAVIAPFKPYIGNAHLVFHLANKDPFGKPTRGITRHYSAHAQGGDELAKIGGWAPDRYLNIYLENYIGRSISNGIVLAYATFPTSYEDNPYSQGVISRADQALSSGSTTFAHEVGHFLSLYHPWNSNNTGVATGVCGDDEVDDTPPTQGHYSTCPLYDTFCATGYKKEYDSATYYVMTGISLPVLIAANTVSTGVVAFEDSLNKFVGQTFKTGPTSSYLDGITVYIAPGATAGGLRMNLYDATGTTLIARSIHSPGAPAGSSLKFNFDGPILAANTVYKFEIDTSGGGHRKFQLRTSSAPDTYADGDMYTGVGANTVVSGTDLTFRVERFYRIDYPDTTNVQNIMDYSSCDIMFTKGQVGRMRATLRSPVGYRSTLVSKENLVITGIYDDTTNKNIVSPSDIAPTAYFTVNRNFVCADASTPVNFTNRSYNDTATVEWTFGNGAQNPTSTANTVSNTFSQPGWVGVSLKASSNMGDNTLTRNDLVYAADPNPTNPVGYFQEFTDAAENARYPIFNYFNTDHRWGFENRGMWDLSCIKYANYDNRTPPNISNATLSPMGDYSDFFTPAFDLRSYGSMCNLSFYSAGAYRTNKPSEMNDKLLVSYSVDCGLTWQTIDSIKKGSLGNNGYIYEPFIPTTAGQWKEQSLPIGPRAPQVFFRFRYYPGVANPANAIYGFDPYATLGTGNNFYIDRINISAAPLGVKNGVIANLGMSIVPNPTNGAATINLNGGDNSQAEITVTDVTGKVVYSTNIRRASANTKVEIPASAISVKGLYLVKVVTEGATETQKLVAY